MKYNKDNFKGELEPFFPNDVIDKGVITAIVLGIFSSSFVRNSSYLASLLSVKYASFFSSNSPGQIVFFSW